MAKLDLTLRTRADENPMAQFNRDGDGFIVLDRTDAGNKAMRDFQEMKAKRRRSKLNQAVQNTLDLGKVKEMLDKIKGHVVNGKYQAGLTVAKSYGTLLSDFIKECERFEQSNQPALELGRQLIMLGKSYYEYADNLELLSNVDYDGVLAHLLDCDIVEPAGIIPKGSKFLKKTALKYPTLHNNMDKVYRFGAKDTIPLGVKEEGSVEQFLMHCASKIGKKDFKVEFSPKIDGVSVNGTIVGDQLMNPQTRGDEEESVSILGLHGITVSENFKAEKPFGIQYEVFVTEEDRVKASEYLGLATPYVSCRHAASGIIHRLCTAEDDNLLQYLSFYPIADEGLEGTYRERQDYIWNFAIVPDDMIDCEEVTVYCNDICFSHSNRNIPHDIFEEFKTARENLSYAIDGAVLTVMDDEYQDLIGREGRTNKYQTAWKFDPNSATAKVKGVFLDTGKKGYRTIQVELKHPVFLDGVRYDHVPVLSAELFDALGLRVGSKVMVHRVGDVIPSISPKELLYGKSLKLPDYCPDCNRKLTIKAKKLCCENSDCRGNVVGKFTNFFEVIGLERYNDSFAEVLHDNMRCKTLLDVIKLTAEDFENAGVTINAATKFHDRVRKALSNKRDYEIVAAMGLPGIGPEKAKTLISKMRLNSKTPVTKSEGLLELAKDVVGPVQSESLYKAISNPTFIQEYQKLMSFGGTAIDDYESLKRVGFTGVRPSKEIIEICRKHGFEAVDGKKFDMLVTNSLGRDSDKMKLARKRNLPIFSVEDFMEKYSDSNS